MNAVILSEVGLIQRGANKVCIDRIMGHSSGNTGEKIYTHKTLEELKEAIELIKN